jgi:hypothetical protein
MSFTVSVPVANIATANAALQSAGWGPGNFNLPVWTGGAMPAFAVLHHIATDAVFQAACAALPGAVVRSYAGLTIGMSATAVAIGGRWGGNAPLLQGNVTPGLYRAMPADGSALWWVIQSFDRAGFPLTLPTYPALVRKARTPGEVAPWEQPLDANDAYKLLNPFIAQPDRVTHLGQTWRVSQGDGAGNNVSVPGAFGWVAE